VREVVSWVPAVSPAGGFLGVYRRAGARS